MEASEAGNGNGVEPTADEKVVKLEEKVKQLESEVATLSVEVEDLEAKVTTLEGGTPAEPPAEPPVEPPAESDRVKQFKQEILQERDKLDNDRTVVTEDEAQLAKLEQELTEHIA